MESFYERGVFWFSPTVLDHAGRQIGHCSIAVVLQIAVLPIGVNKSVCAWWLVMDWCELWGEFSSLAGE